jgi:hypothetical protein
MFLILKMLYATKNRLRLAPQAANAQPNNPD